MWFCFHWSLLLSIGEGGMAYPCTPLEMCMRPKAGYLEESVMSRLDMRGSTTNLMLSACHLRVHVCLLLIHVKTTEQTVPKIYKNIATIAWKKNSFHFDPDAGFCPIGFLR